MERLIGRIVQTPFNKLLRFALTIPGIDGYTRRTRWTARVPGIVAPATLHPRVPSASSGRRRCGRGWDRTSCIPTTGVRVCARVECPHPYVQTLLWSGFLGESDVLEAGGFIWILAKVDTVLKAFAISALLPIHHHSAAGHKLLSGWVRWNLVAAPTSQLQ